MQRVFHQIFLVLLWMSGTVQTKSLFQPLDCSDIYKDISQSSGVHMIYPAGPNSGRYVYCDMQTDGGKWTVSNNTLLAIDSSSYNSLWLVWDDEESSACYFPAQLIGME